MKHVNMCRTAWSAADDTAREAVLRDASKHQQALLRFFADVDAALAAVAAQRAYAARVEQCGRECIAKAAAAAERTATKLNSARAGANAAEARLARLRAGRAPWCGDVCAAVVAVARAHACVEAAAAAHAHAVYEVAYYDARMSAGALVANTALVAVLNAARAHAAPLLAKAVAARAAADAAAARAVAMELAAAGVRDAEAPLLAAMARFELAEAGCGKKEQCENGDDGGTHSGKGTPQPQQQQAPARRAPLSPLNNEQLRT
jgi:hypothetical protein